MSDWQLIGRRSSLYTRVVRVFSMELAVPLELVHVSDIASLDPVQYGGHPALKLPTLRIGDEHVFGTEQICRRIASTARRSVRVAWPEDLRGSLCANAQELVWHAMTAQVHWIMTVQLGHLPADNPSLAKARAGFEGALRWLDGRLDDILRSLPAERDVSLLEVTLHCLVEHLPFRQTVDLEDFQALKAFSVHWAQRDSSRSTQYQFESTPPRSS